MRKQAVFSVALWEDLGPQRAFYPVSVFISNLLKACCLDWKAAGSDSPPTHTHTHSKANDNTGHKCWQYWPTEEPGFQKLYETGHFYDFGLIPFTALYVKIYCMATLYFPITCINIRESAWRPVLFQHTDAIWHNTLKTIYKACQ